MIKIVLTKCPFCGSCLDGYCGVCSRYYITTIDQRTINYENFSMGSSLDLVNVKTNHGPLCHIFISDYEYSPSVRKIDVKFTFNPKIHNIESLLLLA